MPRTEVYQLRLTSEEKAQFAELARERGLSIANLIRERVLGRTFPNRSGKMVEAVAEDLRAAAARDHADEAERLADVAKRIDVAAGIHREKLEQVDLPQLVTKLKGQGMTTPVATREARKRLGL